MESYLTLCQQEKKHVLVRGLAIIGTKHLAVRTKWPTLYSGVSGLRAPIKQEKVEVRYVKWAFFVAPCVSREETEVRSVKIVLWRLVFHLPKTIYLVHMIPNRRQKAQNGHKSGKKSLPVPRAS